MGQTKETHMPMLLGLWLIDSVALKNKSECFTHCFCSSSNDAKNSGKLPNELCEIVSPLPTSVHFTQLESSRSLYNRNP